MNRPRGRPRGAGAALPGKGARPMPMQPRQPLMRLTAYQESGKPRGMMPKAVKRGRPAAGGARFSNRAAGKNRRLPAFPGFRKRGGF